MNKHNLYPKFSKYKNLEEKFIKIQKILIKNHLYKTNLINKTHLNPHKGKNCRNFSLITCL